MTRQRTRHTDALSRRAFLASTGGALVGMSALGLAGQAAAAQRHSQRSGTLKFSARSDIGGLDAHKHNLNHTTDATAAMYTGLTDIDIQGNIVDHEYEFESDGKKIAETSKKWFRLRDSYGVEVAPDQNDVLILAATVAIDMMTHGTR